jgi:hypothetical protein
LSAPHDPEKWEPVFGQDHAANESPVDLVCELLAQSLAAWRVAGNVTRASDGALVIGGSRKDIQIDRAPPHLMFRWTVTVDGRQRPAISLVAVLRQVREALDPGYAANRVRIAVAPLVPS